MKLFISVMTLAMVSTSAFAANKAPTLCLPQAKQALKKLYKQTTETNPTVESIDDYVVGKNGLNEDVVQYYFNVRTSGGSRYTSITLAKKDCSFMAGSTHLTKEDMLQDDFDAAETPQE